MDVGATVALDVENSLAVVAVAINWMVAEVVAGVVVEAMMIIIAAAAVIVVDA